MKITYMKKAVSILVTSLVLMAFAIVSTNIANAEGGYRLEMPTTVYAGQTVYPNITNGEEWAEITKLQLSNTKVAKVAKSYGEYCIKTKKKGSTKVTVTYKTSEGQTGTFSKTLRVRAYPNHIKSLTINGSKVKLKGDNRYYCFRHCRKNSVKIKLKLRKGWKITRVIGRRYRGEKNYKIKGIKKMVKNGKKISFPKKYHGMWIGIEMKKGKRVMYYDINLFRK